MHHRISNTRISVGMVLHGMSYYIGNFVVTAIIQLFQRMHNTTLNRLKSIFNSRNGALQNYIRRIVQKPIFVHSSNFGDGILGVFVVFVKMISASRNYVFKTFLKSFLLGRFVQLVVGFFNIIFFFVFHLC